MDNKGKIIGVVAGLLAVGLLAAPAQAHERDRGQDRDHRPHYVKRHHPSHGEIVVQLPGRFISVVIGGKRYYRCHDVYYRKHGRHYVVVAPPHEAVVVDSDDHHGKGRGEIESVFTVYIPNFGGGYTTVIVKRSGDGFVGPQGEFYPEFPKVEQLKVMYAKAK